MRKTIYISGAITGKKNYMADFRNAEMHLAKQIAKGNLQYTSVINPAKVCSVLPLDLEWDDYMKVCYRLLELCDAIYMLKGWESSKGANRELIYAKNMGLEVIYQE
jgi:hypothetical protein